MAPRRTVRLLLLATLAAAPFAATPAFAVTEKPTKPAAKKEAPKKPAAAPAIPAGAFTPKLVPVAPGQAPTNLEGATLSPAPTTTPDDADPVYSAFQRGRWLATMALAIPRAEAGDTAAMTMIGTLYEGGLGVPADLAKAARWYGLAADKGDREAQAALAQMLLAGRGLPRDDKRAWTLFSAAAEKNQPIALFNGAVMMLDGRYAPHDVDKAADWMRRAAEQGNIEAQYAYATMLSDPDNPHADPVAAARFMREAATAGFEAAEIDFALMLINGRGVRKSAENAFVWFRRSALRGNAIGRNRLARMYAAGIGTDPDPVAALTFHILAKRQGLADVWLETRLADLSDADRARATREADRLDARNAGIEADEGEAAPNAPAAPASGADKPAPRP